MARTIWKFRLEANRPLAMPEGSRVLTVHEQHNYLYLWAEVDTANSIEQRSFDIYGTGHPMPDDPGTYVGTAHVAAGSFVFHVYEKAKQE